MLLQRPHLTVASHPLIGETTPPASASAQAACPGGASVNSSGTVATAALLMNAQLASAAASSCSTHGPTAAAYIVSSANSLNSKASTFATDVYHAGTLNAVNTPVVPRSSPHSNGADMGSTIIADGPKQRCIPDFNYSARDGTGSSITVTAREKCDKAQSSSS